MEHVHGSWLYSLNLPCLPVYLSLSSFLQARIFFVFCLCSLIFSVFLFPALKTTHRAMGDKCMHALVESNPIIARKRRAHLKAIHKAKIRNMKSFGGSTTLPKGLHIRKRKLVRKRNLKQEQQTEEWLTSVERENRRLLEKMSLVMLGKDQDPGRYRLAAKYRHFSTVNGPARAKEQKRIDKDNKISKERINKTDAYYQTEKDLEERMEMEVKIRYMCKYDAPLLKKGKAAKLRIKRTGKKGLGSSKSKGRLKKNGSNKTTKSEALRKSVIRSAGASVIEQ